MTAAAVAFAFYPKPLHHAFSSYPRGPRRSTFPLPHSTASHLHHGKLFILRPKVLFVPPSAAAAAHAAGTTSGISGRGERDVSEIFLFGAVVAGVVVLASALCCGAALAAAGDSIRASGFGLKVAAALRGLGWPDEAVVVAVASLPVLELRGAIPVGYWMQLDPFRLTALSVFGNMIPVPFIVLFLKKFAAFLAGKNAASSRFVEMLFERAREKAAPVEEFRWLGLMLFVAVPFPGTGAWTGAIVASILDMPFWSAVSANFVGVVLAGLLVNLLVNLGLKYAVVTGMVLFLVSTFMWAALRSVKRSLSSN